MAAIDADATELILGLIAAGSTVTAACEMGGIARHTFTDHAKRDDPPGLEARYEAAIESMCDALADDAIRIANTPHYLEERTEGTSGVSVTTKDATQHRKLQIDTRLRLLGQWSKRYSPRSTADVTHAVDDEQIGRIVREIKRA